MAKSTPFTLADLEAKGFVADSNGMYAKNNVGKPIDLVFPPISKLEKSNIDSKSIEFKKSSRPKAKIKTPKAKPEGLQAIERVLKTANVKYVTEHTFSDTRKFRFDIAILDKKIAVEYEGIFSDKSRHTGFKGYTNDAIKYNLAQIEGWKVLRYTALNYKHFVDDLKKLLYV